jgi:hypothetical protein|tara:strand:+ start:238 stop:510 length:273 start_codon:yes stop_codon:yes gene_type:complete
MQTKKKKGVREKKSPDIDIKVRNLDKVIKAEGKKKNYCSAHQCGHFWIFGSALAMVLSFTKNASILWAILHGVLSWFYILFRAVQGWGWF